MAFLRAFKVYAGLCRRRRQSLLLRGGQLSAGGKHGRGCVWPPGSGERSGEMGPGQGALVGPSPRLGDAGRSAKMSAPQGQVEVNSPPELTLDIKAKRIPGCLAFPVGAHILGPGRDFCPLVTPRTTAELPIGHAPASPKFREETQSFSAKSSEAGGGNTPGPSFGAGNSGSEKPKGEQRA